MRSVAVHVDPSRVIVPLDNGTEATLWVASPQDILVALVQRMAEQNVEFEVLKPEADL